MAVETHKSFCRFCHVFCGVEVDVEDGRVLAVRGDRENPVTRGYTCPKGRAEVERIHHPERVLAPRKRSGEGFETIGSEQALDEIALKLRAIIDEHGPDSVAVYVGCGGHRSAAGGPWFLQRWMRALGSSRFYTSFTIDSPSLVIAGNRFFGAPVQANLLDVERADAVLFVGTNPIASHQLTMPQSNPTARLQAARKRGMKLIVMDPRRSDCARQADIHLQLRPGEDSTLLAAMIKVILDRGLQDREYCDQYLSGIDALHEAVSGFDLDYASQRSGVPAALIEEAAVTFASAATGGAQSGTGMHMAPHHNLATQLVMTLNGLCGRYDRAGGLNRNEGVLQRPVDETQGPIRLPQPPVSRIRDIPALNGLFGMYFEMPTSTLPDEILAPGPQQIRALIVNGGNPALVLSEEARTLEALESLELLVVNDLFQSATAEYADYLLPVKHPFERPDLPKLMDGSYPFPFGHYAETVVDGPPECMEEWEIFWELGRRLELPLRVGALDMSSTPTSEEMLAQQFRHARVPIEELRKHPSGKIYGDAHLKAGGVIPRMLAHPDQRMAAGHPEVLRELAEVRAESVPEMSEQSDAYRFRMITYRMKEAYCTQGQNLPSLRNKRRFNPVLMHPEVMRELGLEDGDDVRVESDAGAVEGVVEGDRNLREDVIGLAFGWGNPAEAGGVREKGVNVQRLITARRDYDPSSGLARQSAVPVNVSPL